MEFLLASGPAEPLQPLRAVASGGESARVMLALKAAPKIAQAAGAQHPREQQCCADPPAAGFALTLQAAGARPDHPRAAPVCGVLCIACIDAPVPQTCNEPPANGRPRKNNRLAATATVKCRSVFSNQVSSLRSLSGRLASTPLALSKAAGDGGASAAGISEQTAAEAAHAAPAAAAGGVLTIEGSDGSSGARVFPMSGASTFDAADTAAADDALAALQTPVMVLDEIDAGLGPRLGASIGRMLHSMSSGGQTLCVSHVPQVRSRRC